MHKKRLEKAMAGILCAGLILSGSNMTAAAARTGENAQEGTEYAYACEQCEELAEEEAWAESLTVADIVARGSHDGYRWVVDAEGHLFVRDDGSGNCNLSNQGWANYKDKILAVDIDVPFSSHLEKMFEGWDQVEEIKIKVDKSEGSAGSMFSGCAKLKSLDVSQLKTKGVTKMGFMFYGCSALEEIDLTGFQTSNVTTMCQMFLGCKSLKTLDLSSFDTRNVDVNVGMVGMFRDCSMLETLDISNFNTGKVTSMNSMFNGCSSLKSLDLHHFNTANVTDMGYMFFGCEAMESLDMTGWKTQNVSEMSYMFYRCRTLTKLDLSGFDLSGVATAAADQKIDLFRDCSSLSEIKSPYNLLAVVDLPSSASWHRDDNKSSITQLPRKLGVSVTIKSDKDIFADVNINSWQYPYARFVLHNNIMSGKGVNETGAVIFDPNGSMTRAEFVQMLYNYELKPYMLYKDKFADVQEGKWYTGAIMWASHYGIVNGKGDIFDVNGSITRQEMTTILYKYAKLYKNYATDQRAELDQFADKDAVKNWAVEGMEWAVGTGIVSGKGSGDSPKLLDPSSTATRAECATVMKHLIDTYQ